MNVLQRQPFPGCCGASVLLGFGSIHNWVNGQWAREVEADIDEAIQNSRRQAMLLATLNEGQRNIDDLRRMLYNKGFRRRGHGWNDGHENNVYLYVRYFPLEEED